MATNTLLTPVYSVCAAETTAVVEDEGNTEDLASLAAAEEKEADPDAFADADLSEPGYVSDDTLDDNVEDALTEDPEEAFEEETDLSDAETDVSDEETEIVEEEPVEEDAGLEEELYGATPSSYFVIEGTTITGLQNGGKNLSRIEIPEDLGITKIGGAAFKGAAATEIILPQTLTTISSEAFAECSKLEGISIPANVTHIWDSAFKNCEKLSRLELQTKKISYAGQWIFQGCAIREVIFPEGITVIPERLFHQAKFSDCDLIIPKSVTSIKALAFCSITGLKSIRFEEGSCLTSIEEKAFYNFPLASVELPESLKKIGVAAFNNGMQLTEIILPANLEEIGVSAFNECEKLHKVTLKSSKIKNNDDREKVFYGCAIDTFVVADGVTNIPQSLFNNAGFSSCDIVFPASVTTIKRGAFAYASGIRSVAFAPGSKLKTIEANAFLDAPSFTKIVFPAGLTTIGDSAFRWTKLSDITIPKSVTKIGNLAFANLPAGARFHVDKGSYAQKWLAQNGFENVIYPSFVIPAITLNVGSQLTLDSAVFDDAGIGGAVFNTANSAIATIVEGNKLLPLKAGNTTLSATLNGSTQSIKVTVYDPTPVIPDVVYLNNRTVTFTMKNGVKTTVWESGDPTIMTLTKKGVAKGVKTGLVTVTATNNGKIISKQVYVCAVPHFSARSVTINAGDTLTLSNYFDDSDIPSGTAYSISSAKVLSLDGTLGKVTGLAKGTCKITAVCDNKKYTMTVNVYDPTISGTDTLLMDNKSATLKVTNGLGTTTWESSAPDVVSVTNKGVIKGLQTGTAVITAVNNNKTLQKTIHVYNVPSFDKLYVTNVGKPVSVALQKDDEMPAPVYTISNKKIATINEDGLVTPIKTGTVTVSAVTCGKKYNTTLKIFDPVINGAATVKAGRTISLSIKNGYGPTTWSVDDSGNAKISETGRLTGIKAGPVTVMAVNNGKTVTKVIEVQ